MATYLIRTESALKEYINSKGLKLTQIIYPSEKYFQVYSDSEGNQYLFDISKFTKEPHKPRYPKYNKQSFEGKKESLEINYDNLFESLYTSSADLAPLLLKIEYPQQKLKEHMEKYSEKEGIKTTYEEELVNCVSSSVSSRANLHNISEQHFLNLAINHALVITSEKYADFKKACEDALAKINKESDDESEMA